MKPTIPLFVQRWTIPALIVGGIFGAWSWLMYLKNRDTGANAETFCRDINQRDRVKNQR